MKTVMVVEPKSCGCDYLRKAKELGFSTVLLTADTGDRRVGDPFRRYADHVEVVDTNDDELAVARCRALRERLPVDGVVPGFEFYVPLAARISHALGLPGLDPDRVSLFRDKDRMRAELVRAGLRTPAHAVVETEAEVAAAVRRIGLPVVVKPVDGAGSTGVRRADSLEQALAAFRLIQGGGYLDLGRHGRGKALIEEFIVGREMSVDGFVQDGGVHVLSFTQKMLGPEPYFVEIAHIVEGDFPPHEREVIQAYAEAVLRTLGLSVGPFHCELRLDERGPVLMEVGARLPGGQISDLIGYATDVDLHGAALKAHMGIPAGVGAVTRRGHAGVFFLTRPGLERYDRVVGLETVRSWPGLKQFLMYYRPGEYLPPPVDWQGRLGYGVFLEDSHRALINRLAEFDHAIRLE